MKKLQKGFSIISAIFLLVVLAFLGTAMVTFSTNQQQSAAMDLMGSRAYQAARAGIEWGAYQVLIAGACTPSTNLPAMAGTLSGFKVTVTCTPTTWSETSVNPTPGTLTVYDLNSTALWGAVGQPDYVERQVQTTIAK